MVSALLFTASASAYTVSYTSDQKLVRFRYGQKLFLAGNPSRPGGFSAPFFQKTIVNALSQWKWATQGMFDFEYWQGTDKNVYEPNLNRNGESSIFFASNSKEATDPNVIGYTQVWYNSNTGDIVEADVLLNDRNYDLTESERDTSSQGVRTGNSKPKVYIGNIITHELGHAIGLSHSSHLNASMLYVEYSEQNKIGCDDIAGAQHLYPNAGEGHGGLTGTVLGPRSDPVPGVSVTAISRSRGIPIATVVTDQSGQFNFAQIESGSVALMLEKFPGSPSTIPAALKARTNQVICNGTQFPTQFVTLADGHQLKEFEIQSGGVQNTGAIRLQCQAVQNFQKPVVNVSNSHFIVDQSSSNAARSYRFFANGPFQVAGIGHLLFSPVKVRLQAYDATGRPIATKSDSPLYQSRSQFQIEDTILSGSAQGWVEVRVTPTSISTARYPTPALWPNSTPFYVLAFNSEASRRPASNLPINARCAAPETLPAYRSPPGDPIRNFSDQTSRDVMGCSQAQASTLRTAPVTDPGSIIGRLLPFLCLAVAQLCFRRRASKLGT